MDDCDAHDMEIKMQGKEKQEEANFFHRRLIEFWKKSPRKVIEVAFKWVQETIRNISEKRENKGY